jgi:hypothetical protein
LEKDMKSLWSLAVAAGMSMAFAAAASAQLIAGWTIDTGLPTGTGLPIQSSYTYGAAESGALAGSASTSLFGVHANPQTAWTSPAGNGSQYSLSSNRWASGDYYQIDLSTSGFSNIAVSWDQARSSTGPQFFDLMYSTDGGANWVTALAGYEVLRPGGGGVPGTRSSSTYDPQYTSTFVFGAELDDQATLSIRFMAASEPSGISGSNRIDNIFVESIPAPGAIAVLGLAGLASRRRRG